MATKKELEEQVGELMTMLADYKEQVDDQQEALDGLGEMLRQERALSAELKRRLEAMTPDPTADEIALLVRQEPLPSVLQEEVLEMVSSWKDVDGACDQFGRLQALDIGRKDRPGVLLRYLNADSRLVMCQPYREARVSDNADGTVTMVYAA